MVSEMAAGLTAAQRRTLIIDAHPGNPLAQRFVDDPGVTLDMVASSQGSLHDAVTQLPFGASVMNVHSRPSTLMHLPSRSNADWCPNMRRLPVISSWC